jgi:CheY-like chemotaxis protein/predicted regulator of Ras-like GTPase activity (Roadblock/LC7/MglB family)
MQEESKTLLIVDDEREFLLSLVDGLQARHPEYRVLTAPNGKEALEILAADQVDVVLTDLRMPVMDGFELLARMNREHWSVPVIVMTAFGSPEIEERVLRTGSLQCLDKPVSFDRVSSAIEQAFSAAGTRSHVRGITLPAFMQLLEMERKTCTVVAAAEAGVARLYFKEGVLLDAETGEKRGVEAAHEVFCWQNCQIEILSSCPVSQRAIDTPLNQLLLEALQLNDEQGLQAETAPAEVVTRDAGDPRLAGIVARLGEVAGVEGVLVIGGDGSVSSWTGPRSLSYERFGELMRYATSSMIDMGIELQIAELRELFIEYEEALILCRPAGRGLVALLGTDLSKIGAVRHKTKQLIAELAAVL